MEPISVDTREAARLTGVSGDTLRRLRRKGGRGPRVVRVGRRVLYEVRELRRWLNSLSSPSKSHHRTQRELEP